MNKVNRRRRPPRRCTPRWYDRPPGIGRLVADTPCAAVLDEVAPPLTRAQEDTLRTFIAPPIPMGWRMDAIRTPFTKEMP